MEPVIQLKDLIAGSFTLHVCHSRAGLAKGKRVQEVDYCSQVSMKRGVPLGSESSAFDTECFNALGRVCKL